jgi:ribose-phosphate pyrophosphokinase
MRADIRVLGFAGRGQQASTLARLAQIDYADIEVHQFPDGESRLLLPGDLPERVVICQTLDRPNSKLVELMLAAVAAREQGAATVILVAPYLCYMRQDKAFHPGEVVSQKVVGAFLAKYFDAVITVDAHLHRIDRLSQAIPLRQALNLSAAETMGRFLQGRFEGPVLVGPDAESEQWVAAIAAPDGLDYCIARKRRFGDRDVEISLPDYDFGGRNTVLVDDVASTGTTLEKAAEELRRRKAGSVSVLVTHALFVDDACSRLERAGVENIWSCDSISHATNRVPLGPLLAAGLQQVLDPNPG